MTGTPPVQQILRSPSSSLPALVPGQLAWVESTSNFAIGLIAGGNQTIGGQSLLASPALTGVPTTPTASAGTSTTQIASTAFVANAITANQNVLTWKNPVRLATAAALPAYTQSGSGATGTLTSTANGPLSVDGIAVVLGDRILVKNGAAAKDNGIYTVTNIGSGVSWVLLRSTDCNSSTSYLDKSTTMVDTGTTNSAGDVFSVTTTGTITVDTTSVTWGQIAGPGTYTAGTGLTLSGNQFSLTIPVVVTSGGTGATTLTGVLKGNGTSAFTAATAGTDYMSPSNVQNQSASYVAAGGTANAQTLTLSPAVTSYVAGQLFSFLPVAANTGAATLNVSGLGTKAITKNGTTALIANDLTTTALAIVEYDGTQFQLINPQTEGVYVAGTGLTLTGNSFALTIPVVVTSGGTGATTLTGVLKGNGTSAFTAAVAGTDYMSPANTQNQSATYATSAGTANAQTLTLSPASGALAAGQQFTFKAGATNTGAMTMAVDGHAATAVTKFGTTALVAGDVTSGNVYTIVYDGTQYQLITSGPIAPVTSGGTGVGTLTGLAKGNGTSAFTAATAGTDYMSPANVQNQSASFATTTGSANAYVLTLSPASGALVAGQTFTFKANFTNTGAATLAVDGHTATALTKNGSTALIAGDINSGNVVEVVYDGTQYQIISSNVIATVPDGGTGVATLTGLVKGNGTSAFTAATAGTDYMSPANVQAQSATYATASFASNAYSITLSPALGSYVAGDYVTFLAANTCTAAATLNINGLGAKNLTKFGTNATVSGDIVNGNTYTCLYDGTQFQIVSNTVGIFDCGTF